MNYDKHTEWGKVMAEHELLKAQRDVALELLADLLPQPLVSRNLIEDRVYREAYQRVDERGSK